MTLLTTESYLVGVLALHFSLQQVQTRYPFIVAHFPGVPEEQLSHLRARGIKTLQVPVLRANWAYKGDESRFNDAMGKLRVFELEEFEQIVFLDADMIVLQNMDELLDESMPAHTVRAAHACVCNPRRNPNYPADWIPENCAHTLHDKIGPPNVLVETMPSTFGVGMLNSGLMVLRPCQADFDSLAASILPDADYMLMGDQALISVVFAGRWQPLPYIYNALKLLRTTHPAMWRDEHVKCVHFILDKPWNDMAEDASSFRNATHLWWWRVYNAMVHHDVARGLAVPRSPLPWLD